MIVIVVVLGILTVLVVSIILFTMTASDRSIDRCPLWFRRIVRGDQGEPELVKPEEPT